MIALDAVRRRFGAWRTRERFLDAPDAYVRCVIAAGICLLLASIRALAIRPPDLGLTLLVLLSIGSAQLMLRMPAVPVSFSVSDIFTFTAALMYGPHAGAVVAAIDAAVLSTRLATSRRSITRYLFNISAVAVAMWVAARWFFLLSGTTALAADPSVIISHVGSLAAFALLYFALNTGLVAAAIALAARRSLWQVWCAHFMSLWPGYVGGAAASGLALFLFSTRHGDFRVLAFVLPIPFILYVTFRTAIARMQDDVAHLTRINSMYLSTIEALAQAVDARDEVTHGHIRRVQKNAMRLARELDVQDELELRALEAAALLHDTGKLAIPEHILNKPDKLTQSEFETMKLHANIGADILSPIEFPFPVVPIVRHHHESWDGSGYPDRLRGEQIPLGARILAVVDCFDALTSDRPYRRALARDRALEVILAQSGRMYDPKVVDAMMSVKDDIVAEESVPSREAQMAPVDAGNHANQAVKVVQPAEPANAAAALQMAGRLGEIVGRHRETARLCEALHEQLSIMTPGLTMVVYELDATLGALHVRAASGVHRRAVEGLAIKLGTRLTGWVAAHRTPIVNSQAALDLENRASQLDPRPRICVSTPLVSRGRLVGVLTFYSTMDRPFGAEEVNLFEMLSGLLGPVLDGDPAEEAAPAGIRDQIVCPSAA
jgi:putative nucleotidyltransferase with HDIG domain